MKTHWNAKIRTLMGVALLLCISVGASAQSRTPPRLWGPTGGLHFGTPAKASVAVGMHRVLEETQSEGERYRDLFAVVEPGLGAGRFSVGYLDSRGNLGTGMSVRGSLLRRWRDGNVDYAGLEISFYVFAMGPRIGMFRSIRGEPNTFRFTADFSIGI